MRFCNGVWIRKYDQKRAYALVAIESMMVNQGMIMCATLLKEMMGVELLSLYFFLNHFGQVRHVLVVRGDIVE